MARVATRRRITPEERDQFRQELIDIARRIFLEEGYAAVTIRRVTSEAGVTAMAFYWYFECKDALLTVIWDELIRESAEVCMQAARTEPTNQQALRYFTAFIDFWLGQRAHFRFIFLNDSHTTDFVQLRRELFTISHRKLHSSGSESILNTRFYSIANQTSQITFRSLGKRFNLIVGHQRSNIRVNLEPCASLSHIVGNHHVYSFIAQFRGG